MNLIALIGAAETGEAAPNPMIPPISEIVVGGAAFAIIFVLFSKFLLPRILKTLDERAEAIEGGLAAAEKAQAEAAAKTAELQEQLKAAQNEAATMREKAREEGAAIVAEMRAQAQAEADRIVSTAKAQVEAEKLAAMSQLRKDTGSMASELASRIVGESLTDTEMQSRVIDRFLAELDAVPTAVKAK